MATLTSGRLAKHLEGEHDQKDHGKWAGKTRAEISEMLSGYPSMDLSELSTYSTLEDMSASDYIDEWMSDSLQSEIDYYRTQWYEDNDPDDEGVFGPDEDMIRQMAYESLEETASEQLEQRKEEIRLSLIEEAREVYGVSGTGPNGEDWYSDVEDMYFTYDGVKVIGSFYVDGDYAGNFERELTEDNAYRAILVINDEYAGLGIAGAFNHQEEMAYLKSGLDTVTITAADLSNGDFNKPPGTYVWASQGYDFASKPGQVITALKRYITGNPEYNALPPRIRATIDDVADRFERLASNDEDYPTPRELSQLGRLPGEEWWAGKSIMAHAGASLEQARTDRHSGPMWNAVKRLSESEGLRVSLGEIRSQQARAETLSAIDQHVAAWRRANPQLDFGTEFIMVNGQPVPIEPSDAQVLSMMGM